jgi:long-chain acyl-CoA synthetase
MPQLDRSPPLRQPAVPVAGVARTIPDLFLRRVAATPRSAAWRVKRDGAWVTSTWSDAHRSASALATYLIRSGIGLGDKICIIGSTRPEWCVADLGGMLAGAVTVGAYPTLAPSQLAYLLDHADVRVAIVEGMKDVEKILEIKRDLPKLERVLVWDTARLDEALRTHTWLVPWKEALATPADRATIDARTSAIDPDGVAILIYTSGTTGPPKGAMISHENILTILRGTSITKWERDDESLSFLPMAHAAERVLAFYGRITYGICTSYASSVPAVLDELKEVRPTVFGSVPRIFEKAYSRIMTEVGKAPPRRQKIFRWAEETALRVVRDWQAGRESPLHVRAQYEVAHRIVFSKLRQAFGGRVKQFLTGAAPIPKPILEFFWGAGIPIYELYGMTEATVVTHGNAPGAVRLGSVGKALAFVEDKIAEDGEILVRGKTVFKGYYKDPEATRAMIDEEGWLHTGDIGRKDADGYVFILDRKKHLIITSGGKNITPSNLENAVKAQDSLISNVHAHGDKRAYCTAIVTVHPLEAIEWAKERGLAGDPAEVEAMRRELMSNPLARPPGLDAIMTRVTSQPELRGRIVEAVRRANRDLSRVEAIKRIHILERDFSLEEDEITPTLKLKRKNIENKLAGVFDNLYSDEGFGVSVEGKGAD